mmetsp:Transcript_13392/g.29153  ORF Transcript_13392/g.29153 Transcript_13392/m.29153 type:complete len:518 (-) Transcript_13392:133-1686(-)
MSDDAVLTSILFGATAYIWLSRGFNRGRGGKSREEADVQLQGHPVLQPRRSTPPNGLTPSTSKRFSNEGVIANDKAVRGSPHRSPRTPGFVRAPADGDGTEERRRRADSLDERRRQLLERVAYSDSVFSRENSLDYHPKNSNWSHFEHYTPEYTPSGRLCLSKHGETNSFTNPASVLDGVEEEDDDDGEDYLWCEPARTSSLANDPDDPPVSANIEYENRRLSSAGASGPCLPSKLILVRHGQSEGNVDEKLYTTKPDNAMRLTDLGWEMARAAGKALRDQIPKDETVHFIVSPYVRTVETFHGLCSAWVEPDDFAHIGDRCKRLRKWYSRLMDSGLTWHEDPRIREQDFGNYQDRQKMKQMKEERHGFGSFYYRFAHGESASDVFDRVSTFLDSLYRSFESGRAQNYVIVAHGVSIRVFLARYFRYSVDQFHMLANPRNCDLVVLSHDGHGRLKLDGRCELELRDEGEEQDGSDSNGGRRRSRKTVVGYRKLAKLRTIPPQYVHHRTARVNEHDTV